MAFWSCFLWENDGRILTAVRKKGFWGIEETGLKMQKAWERGCHVHGGTNREIGHDFSVNINPLGIPEASKEAAGMAAMDAGRYPDVCHNDLVRVLSVKNGGHHVILGNGSCELIYALCHYIGHKYPGYEAYTAAPTFSEYGYAVAASYGRNRIFSTSDEDDFTLDGRIDDFIECICSQQGDDTVKKLVFLCNPNNPTGELLKRDRIEKIADVLSDRGDLLLVDECFLRFNKRYGETTMTGVLSHHSNVIVMDAFTKFYAMPGLRLGYAVSADGELLDGIRGALQPWNVSDRACSAALLALEDPGYEERTVGFIEKQRRYLTEELLGIPLRVIGEPAGPFIMFEGPGGLRESLNSRGFDIRDCMDMLSHYDTDRHYYRIAVRTEEDNRLLIECLKELMVNIK